MRRFAMEALKKWKAKENRKPLLIMGARQVGKTWLMKEFGRTEYKKVAYISFYNNRRMAEVFGTDRFYKGDDTMKTKKEPTARKEEPETLNRQPAELSEEELAQVSGGWDYKEYEVSLPLCDEDH